MTKERIVIPDGVDVEFLMDSLGYKHVQGGEYITELDYEYFIEKDGTKVIISPPQKENIGRLIGHWWNLFWRKPEIIKMKKGKYITVDLETGGLWRDVSLLTAYFAVLDKDFNLIDELDLKLIPDDGIYKVEPDGMAVNKIDLVELAKEAIPYKEAKSILYDFLKKNYSGEFLTPIGQGVMADMRKLSETIISKGSWDSFVSRRALDTMYIARYLQEIGKIPKDMTIRLFDLVDYFKVRDNVKGNQHEAKFDALATVEVLKEMLKL